MIFGIFPIEKNVYKADTAVYTGCPISPTLATFFFELINSKRRNLCLVSWGVNRNSGAPKKWAPIFFKKILCMPLKQQTKAL